MSCPLGYICTDDGSKKFPCKTIQEKALKQFRIGDVYAGIYCPEGENVIKNCDEGYYCPDPSTKLMCPSKYYCPHKVRTAITSWIVSSFITDESSFLYSFY